VFAVLISAQQQIQAWRAAHPHIRRLIVGYSGGLDSHVLLHWLATQQPAGLGCALQALHVDHGLQAASAAWGEQCAAVCRALQVPLRICRVDARPAPGESPEAAARRARYAAFAADLGPDAALLTAHHRDDQAETLLLQLLRGAGPHGLAAMPAVSRLGRGWLWRPFLDIDRAALQAYAEAQALHWIEDASNANTDFDRNYLRHRVLPLLRQRWPAVQRTLARSARHCAETAVWLDVEAERDLRAARSDAEGLSIRVVRELDEPRQRNLLRYWLRCLRLPVPDARQLARILHDTLQAAADRNPCVCWPGGEVRRYRGVLYALPPQVPHDARQILPWRAQADDAWPPLAVPNLGSLRMQKTVGAGLRAAVLTGGVLQVRFRRGGERFHPVGRAHGQELKKLLQDAGIPPWQRERLPLLYREDVLLVVPGLGVASAAAAAPGEPGWELLWQPLTPRGSG
jgi:tRNA(Ile)-lysidine synthase